VVAITDFQAAQIAGAFALYRIGAVAVGAVLIEQACAFRHQVFPALVGIFQCFGGFLRRNTAIEKKEKQGRENEKLFHEHGRPAIECFSRV
jgi:hypothetical protein